MIFAFADTDVAYWLFEFRNGNRARAAATGKFIYWQTRLTPRQPPHVALLQLSLIETDTFENCDCSTSSELFPETLPNPSENITKVSPNMSQHVPKMAKK